MDQTGEQPSMSAVNRCVSVANMTGWFWVAGFFLMGLLSQNAQSSDLKEEEIKLELRDFSAPKTTTSGYFGLARNPLDGQILLLQWRDGRPDVVKKIHPSLYAPIWPTPAWHSALVASGDIIVFAVHNLQEKSFLDWQPNDPARNFVTAVDVAGKVLWKKEYVYPSALVSIKGGQVIVASSRRMNSISESQGLFRVELSILDAKSGAIIATRLNSDLNINVVVGFSYDEGKLYGLGVDARASNYILSISSKDLNAAVAAKIDGPGKNIFDMIVRGDSWWAVDARNSIAKDPWHPTLYCGKLDRLPPRTTSLMDFDGTFSQLLFSSDEIVVAGLGSGEPGRYKRGFQVFDKSCRKKNSPIFSQLNSEEQGVAFQDGNNVGYIGEFVVTRGNGDFLDTTVRRLTYRR